MILRTKLVVCLVVVRRVLCAVVKMGTRTVSGKDEIGGEYGGENGGRNGDIWGVSGDEKEAGNSGSDNEH